MYPKCLWCEKELINGWKPMRSGANFCCDEHRSKYHNAKKKVRRDERTAFMLVAYFQDMSKKDGELGELAMHALNLMAKNAASENQVIKCKACGQSRFTLPSAGDKCSFCKAENWSIK